jgi:hypothetical protein
MLKGFVLLCGLVGAAWAQQSAAGANQAETGAKVWEAGVIGGFGYAPNLSVTGPAGSGNTGFKNGVIAGVFGGNDTYDYWSGEARYMYRASDLKLSSHGTLVDFGGHTHIFNGDIVALLRPRPARLRPFFAFGGGVKLLEGTGAQSAAQPLGRLAALTHTRETLATGDVALGVKLNWWKSFRLRLEVRDYISPSPKKVIAAAPGESITGIMNDVQALAAASYTW